MSKVRLYGDTSGFVDLKAPDVASNVTITLPNTTGPFATETYVDSAIAAIPEIAGIGSNVVAAYTTSILSTTSTSFVDASGLSVTITPTSATSKVLVIAQAQMSNSFAAATSNTLAQVVRGATAIGAVGISNSDGENTWDFNDYSVFLLDSPATTSATTYKVQFRVTANTGYINRRRFDTTAGSSSSIVAIEVAA